MNYNLVFSQISFVLFLGGYVPYILGIFKKDEAKKVRPAILTWAIWIVVDGLLIWQMVLADALNWQVPAALIGTVIVFLLSLRYGVLNFSIMTAFLIACCMFGIFVWLASGNDVLGIIISSSILFIGIFPTLGSVWKDPSRENKIGWGLWLTSSVFALLAIPEMSVQYLAPPISFFVGGFIVLLTIAVKEYNFDFKKFPIH